MSLARSGDVLGFQKAMIAEATEEAKNIGTEMVHVREYTNYAVAMAAEMIQDGPDPLCSVVWHGQSTTSLRREVEEAKQ
jgi:hypothetical protein